MPPARSTRPFWSRRKARFRRFGRLLEVFTAKGLPSSLYTDRGSHYFFTPKAGEAVDKERLTQVGRALARLGIEHIPAYSPQARGRSERMFGTLQDRLPKELSLPASTISTRPIATSARSICRCTTSGSPGRRRSPRERLRGVGRSRKPRRHPVHRAGARRGPRQHRRL